MNTKNNEKFWTDGNGNDFLKWANFNLQSQNTTFSKDLFRQYDSKLDVLVKKWSKEGTLSSIMSYLHTLQPDENLDSEFLQFKDSLSTVPSWLNFDLIHQGAILSQRSGLIGLLVLRNFALLGGYYFTNLTEPLVKTGALKKGVVYRLYNTLRFWVDVSRHHDNAQQLRLNACLKTRIIHSASRLMIEKSDTNWDYDAFGVPINHADMIATNIAFTVYFLYGLDQLNFKYTPKEEEGIFHLWKYVTWLLGVPEDLIPNNKEEALSFFHSWTLNQQLAGNSSVELAKALIEDDTTITLFKWRVIRDNIGNIHKSIANYLLDDTILNALQIPNAKFESAIVKVVQTKNRFQKSTNNQIIKGNAEQLIALEDYKQHK